MPTPPSPFNKSLHEAFPSRIPFSLAGRTLTNAPTWILSAVALVETLLASPTLQSIQDSAATWIRAASARPTPLRSRLAESIQQSSKRASDTC